MVCLYCGGELAVSNSRPQKSRNQTWRRRPCKACSAVFTSTEAIDLSQAIAVSQAPVGGHETKVEDLQPFDRDRLFISLYKSLQHRPAATSDARSLADTITARLIPQITHGLISRQTIAQTALQALQRFDTAAASHYAAFHKQSI